MDTILKYYYGITTNDVKKKDDYYIITSDNNTFLYAELYEDISQLEIIINILNKTNIKYHLLVLTKDNNLYSIYEGKKYCLLKVRINQKEKISFNTFIKTKTKGTSNWGDIWSKRVDYYETQIEELIKEPNIKYALEYYIGLTEIAIYYSNQLNKKYDNRLLTYSICHRRITSPINRLDYYNPLNMIIDIEVRDIAEYIKSAFFNEILTESELLNIVNNIHLNEATANYFFLRLLYPSYYFNLYDEYILNKTFNPKMVLYIKKSKEYESLLSKIYTRISLKNNLIIRPWFIKSQH